MTRTAATLLLAILLTLTLWAPVAAATETGGGMPWNEPLTRIKDDLTGPTATVIILIAMAVGLMLWSLTDSNQGLMRAGKAVVAIAVVATLGSFLSALGISAAAL